MPSCSSGVLENQGIKVKINTRFLYNADKEQKRNWKEDRLLWFIV